MSVEWKMLPRKAAMRPSRKTGRTMVMSLRCPVPRQPSFEISTSPGRSASRGMHLSMCPSVIGIVPTKEGTEREDCASWRPWLSISPIAMSQLSRTTEEKEVRTKACAPSSISPAMRCHPA
jgi:hypothetical protein